MSEFFSFVNVLHGCGFIGEDVDAVDYHIDVVRLVGPVESNFVFPKGEIPDSADFAALTVSGCGEQDGLVEFAVYPHFYIRFVISYVVGFGESKVVGKNGSFTLELVSPIL